MSAWDDEDFVPSHISNHINFEGEDEDDDGIKDNWDDEEEEKAEVKTEPKKKKTFEEKMREKEAKKKEEILLKMEEMKLLEEQNRELTPEEMMDEKLKQQRAQEESDLELAKDAFGVADEPSSPVHPEVKTIDTFVPTNRTEFQELSTMIVQKLSTLELRSDYLYFLETTIRDCCAGFEPEDIKKISNTLNLLVQEKQKQSKAIKGKKKTGAPKKTLAAGKGTKDDKMDYDDSYYNEYEDFM